MYMFLNFIKIPIKKPSNNNVLEGRVIPSGIEPEMCEPKSHVLPITPQDNLNTMLYIILHYTNFLIYIEGFILHQI